MARMVAAGIALGCLSVLLVAAGLTPSPAGTGTHVQLGLPPCSLMVQAGVPCPACGMTTSFALMVRGNILRAVDTQPAGALLAVVAALTVWVGMYVALTGKPGHRLLRQISTASWLWLIGTAVVSGWLWKTARVLGWI